MTAGSSPELPDPLRFEWDEVKAARNVVERGLPFDLAETILTTSGLILLPDPEHSESESRWRAYNRVDLAQGPRVLLTIITVRWPRVRVISLRACKRREVQQYEQLRRQSQG